MTHLAHSFAPEAGVTDDPLRLTRIGLIGAKMRDGSDFQLIEADQGYLEDTLRLMRDFDLPHGNNLQVSVINKAYGQDYLAPARTGAVAPNEQIDVAVACYLHNPQNPNSFRLSERNRGNAWISPWHDAPGIWAQASAAHGAKVVVVFAYNPETDLMAGAFNRAPYIPLIDFVGPDGGPFGHGSGGLLMHRDYARDLMQQGRAHHMLQPYIEANLHGMREALSIQQTQRSPYY